MLQISTDNSSSAVRFKKRHFDEVDSITEGKNKKLKRPGRGDDGDTSSNADDVFTESWNAVGPFIHGMDERTSGDLKTCMDALSEWFSGLHGGKSKYDLCSTLFLILRMGGGKGSLIVNLGKMARKHNKMLILVASLNAIKMDLKRRFETANIVTKVYMRGDHHEGDLLKEPPTVLILTAESVFELLRSCTDTMEHLIKSGILDRVIIDEADSFVFDQVRNALFFCKYKHVSVFVYNVFSCTGLASAIF